jgi:nucleoid DNA-binding protein
MEKPEIVRRLAQRSGVSPGEAADRLDKIVYQILEKLRHGQSAPLPGLGLFHVGADGRIKFQRSKAQKND